ncbi:hypothetical protein ACOMHN_004569 [Nucella lapillus]
MSMMRARVRGHRWVDHPAAAVMKARVPGQWVDCPAAVVMEAREQGCCWIDHPAVAVMEARVQGRHWVDRPSVGKQVMPNGKGERADIYDKVVGDIENKGLDCEVLGGGRIEHEPSKKTIKIYGYSQVRPCYCCCCCCCCEMLGGRRIEHEPSKKTIKIYGYSQQYGRADHSITQTLLLRKFKDYEHITWSNDGY